MIPVSQSTDSQLFVVGSYTEPYGAFRAVGDGVSLVSFNPSGGMAAVACLALPNPSYLRPIAPDRIAVVLETDDDRAGIAIVRVNGKRLELEERIPSPGRIPCHLDLHPSGRWLAGACYGTGDVFALPLNAGRLSRERMISIRRSGSSIHPVRQTGPHPHAARFSPDGAWLIVPDLGTDEVVIYPFDSAAGPDFSQPNSWPVPKGSGPRLPLFSSDGRHIVLVEEIASRIVSLRWQDGNLTEIESASSLLTPFDGENTAAGLRWHPSGRIVAVSNRGANSISFFKFDTNTGHLTPWRTVASGGRKPRDLTFSHCGKWLVTTNQDSDCLALYAIDVDISDTGRRLSIKSPSCIRPLPLR